MFSRYAGFHEPPWAENKYDYTVEYWHILAAQFIFVFIFEVSIEYWIMDYIIWEQYVL